MSNGKVIDFRETKYKQVLESLVAEFWKDNGGIKFNDGTEALLLKYEKRWKTVCQMVNVKGSSFLLSVGAFKKEVYRQLYEWAKNRKEELLQEEIEKHRNAAPGYAAEFAKTVMWATVAAVLFVTAFFYIL